MVSPDSPASFPELFHRCLRGRCPVCGEGRLFERLAELSHPIALGQPIERCSACAFVYRREPGYFFGAVIPLLPLLSLGMGALFAVLAYLTMNPESVEAVIPWGMLGILFGWVSLYRPVICLYIAADHALNPPEEHLQLICKNASLRDENRGKTPPC